MREHLTLCFIDETGATAIEYRLIAGLISVIIASIPSLGTRLHATFGKFIGILT